MFEQLDKRWQKFQGSSENSFWWRDVRSERKKSWISCNRKKKWGMRQLCANHTELIEYPDQFYYCGFCLRASTRWNINTKWNVYCSWKWDANKVSTRIRMKCSVLVFAVISQTSQYTSRWNDNSDIGCAPEKKFFGNNATNDLMVCEHFYSHFQWITQFMCIFVLMSVFMYYVYVRVHEIFPSCAFHMKINTFFSVVCARWLSVAFIIAFRKHVAILLPTKLY